MKKKNRYKSFLIILGVVFMVFISISTFAANEFDSQGRMIAKYGSPVIDGEIDEIWESTPVYEPEIIGGDIDTTASFRTLWDDNALYILVEVKADTLCAQSATPYMQDSIEIFMDENNDKTREFGVDDLQFRVNYLNIQTADKGDMSRFYTATRETDDGYIIEARIALRNEAEDGQVMGLELQVNDAVDGNRAGTLNVFDETGMAWDNTALFGEVILKGKEDGAEPGLNPYDMINQLENTQDIDLSLYKNSDIIQETIDQQYNDLLAAIDRLEYTDEAANEKWFVATPDEYKLEADAKGRIERVYYESVNADTGTDTKPLNVYLPHNYDENTKYNVYYLMHGNSENVNTALGGPGDEKELKTIIDNMIAFGDIDPLIVVAPTFYAGSDGPNSGDGQGIEPEDYHEEVINEVIPFVESKYSTYAESTDRKGLEDSREHRAFGGFSRGSRTTWHVFKNNFDYIKYYTPLANAASIGGDSEEIAENLANTVRESNYTLDDFYLFCANGTDDLTFGMMSAQIEAMKEYDVFRYSSDTDKGNFYYMVTEGAGHTWYWVNQYIYNILPDLFVK